MMWAENCVDILCVDSLLVHFWANDSNLAEFLFKIDALMSFMILKNFRLQVFVENTNKWIGNEAF